MNHYASYRAYGVKKMRKHEIVAAGYALLFRIVRDARYRLESLSLFKLSSLDFCKITFGRNLVYYYRQIIAPLGATISRGEGEASDGGELQKG